MENSEAKACRKEVIEDLRSLPKAKRVEFLTLTRETARYKQAKEIHAKEHAETSAKTDSVEQIRSAEQIAAEIIEMLKTNPHIEFLVSGIGNLQHAEGVDGYSHQALKAGATTNGLLEGVRDTKILEFLDNGFIDRKVEASIRDFEPYLKIIGKGGKVYLLNAQKIRGDKQDRSNDFLRDIRGGRSFVVGLTIDEREDARQSIPREFRKFLKEDLFPTRLVMGILDNLAKHFTPDYFNYIQKLGVKCKAGQLQ